MHAENACHTALSPLTATHPALMADVITAAVAVGSEQQLSAAVARYGGEVDRWAPMCMTPAGGHQR